jgi:hypothetical protein
MIWTWGVSQKNAGICRGSEKMSFEYLWVTILRANRELRRQKQKGHLERRLTERIGMIEGQCLVTGELFRQRPASVDVSFHWPFLRTEFLSRTPIRFQVPISYQGLQLRLEYRCSEKNGECNTESPNSECRGSPEVQAYFVDQIHWRSKGQKPQQPEYYQKGEIFLNGSRSQKSSKISLG